MAEHNNQNDAENAARDQAARIRDLFNKMAEENPPFSTHVSVRPGTTRQDVLNKPIQDVVYIHGADEHSFLITKDKIMEELEKTLDKDLFEKIEKGDWEAVTPEEWGKLERAINRTHPELYKHLRADAKNDADLIGGSRRTFLKHKIIGLFDPAHYEVKKLDGHKKDPHEHTMALVPGDIVIPINNCACYAA